MPASDRLRIQLLVEDRSLERFAREALIQLGVDRQSINLTPYPVGRGSAKQWIDQQYQLEVRRLRSNNFQQNLGLVIGTDADEQTVNQRIDQLRTSLLNAGIDDRGSSERIIFWIPEWNIETWLLFLSRDGSDSSANLQIDEFTNYKTQRRMFDYKTTARKFVELARKVSRDEPVAALPALVVACKETNRLQT